MSVINYKMLIKEQAGKLSFGFHPSSLGKKAARAISSWALGTSPAQRNL